MKIANREISSNCPPYIIAEVSGNHNGSKAKALQLIQDAKAAGANAVKFQAYTPDTITIDHDGPGFVLREGLWKGRKLYDLYKEAHTPFSWFPALFECAHDVGITCFASAFDKSSVDMLERLKAPAYKVASFELVDIPLIKYIAKTNKPIILSTGMASNSDIIEADDTLSAEYPHAFLHCISGYPTPVEQANLWKIGKLMEYAVPVGLSDHTLGNEVAIAGVALGACIIEKHLIHSRKEGGADATFSMEPDEFAEMVKQCNAIWEATQKAPATSEEPVTAARKSLYVVKPIPSGGMITEENVRAIRPAYGLPPKFLDAVVGRRAKYPLKYGQPLSWDDLQPES